MKTCARCQTPIQPKPYANNVRFCSKTCRIKAEYIRKGGKERVRQDYYNRHGGQSENTMQCLLCGLWFTKVGAHIVQRHGMTAREYREDMELEVKRGLLRGEHREHLKETALKNGTAKNVLEAGKPYRFVKGGPVPTYKRSKETIEKLLRNRYIPKKKREEQ